MFTKDQLELLKALLVSDINVPLKAIDLVTSTKAQVEIELIKLTNEQDSEDIG